jgi:hypothetical protein
MKTIKPEDYAVMGEKQPRIRSTFTHALKNLTDDYLFIAYKDWNKSMKPFDLIKKYIKNPQSTLYGMKFWCDAKKDGWVIGKQL